MFQWLLLLAEDPPATPTPGNPAGPLGGSELIFLMLIVMVGFYFLVVRPGNKRQEQERLNLLKGLKKNDRILTIAGVYGVVVSVSDTEDEVVVKVDDNCRMKMQKAAIAKNLTNEEAARAAKETKPAETSSTTSKA